MTGYATHLQAVVKWCMSVCQNTEVRRTSRVMRLSSLTLWMLHVPLVLYDLLLITAFCRRNSVILLCLRQQSCGGNVIPSVCLSVCLLPEYLKSYWRIWTKLWPITSRLDFRTDPGLVWWIFPFLQHREIGHF